MSAPQLADVFAPDGVVLRGLRWPGASDAVVLIHDAGQLNDLEDWNPLLPDLARDGVSVFAFDLRGHGASDGDWDQSLAPGDISAFLTSVKTAARRVVVVAIGAGATAALIAMETTPVDGVVLISATLAPEEPAPRGAGVSKLLISGIADPGQRLALDRLRAASIGWAMAVNLPTSDRGAALLTGAWAGQVRDHVTAFIRERCYSGGPEHPGAGRTPARFLEQIGLQASKERQ